MPKANSNKKLLSRRVALKTLAAAAGAFTLANLPNKWETPVVEVGALPAHAQVTGAMVPVTNNGTSTATVSLYFMGAGVVSLNSGQLVGQKEIPPGGSYTFSGLAGGSYTVGVAGGCTEWDATPIPATFELPTGGTQNVTLVCLD